jgi:hypothetical protein
MTTELREFNTLIEDLKSVINQSNFDKVFKTKTSRIPKPKQFLIKMELKRLAAPCNRTIDLRGHVQGDPQPFEYDGRTHYLDDLAKGIFKEQIEKFGQYTVGCFEAIQSAENNNRVIHKKEQEKRLEAIKSQSDQTQVSQGLEEPKPIEIKGTVAKTTTFTQYGIRSEERMNFSIPVELQLGLGDVLPATSSDLSVSGIRVKVPESRTFTPGQKVAIYLTGLEQEFELGLKDGIQYEVVDTDPAAGNSKYLRLKRTYDDDIAAFNEFLGNFINGNKRRYKVNFDNTIEAITVKGYEQYYLPRVTSLPIYIRHVKERFLPTLALATENNRQVLGYFSDEQKNLVFQQVLSQKRILRLAKSESTQNETYLFCFTHAKAGKLYFYSATLEELEQDQRLLDTFIGFGCRKESWQVFKLQLSETSFDDAYLPLSIPDTASSEIKKYNAPPPPKVEGLLKDLTYIVNFTAISNAKSIAAYQASYNFDAKNLGLLKNFSHPKLKSYVPIEVDSIDYVNLRSEERYLYKTSVAIEVPEKEDEFLQGTTRDISTYGLQVVLAHPCEFKKGEILILALTDFQKATNAFKLSKLPYEIMAVSRDKTIMNLRVYDPRGGHQGRKFLYRLIKQNVDKLTPAKIESRYPGLSKALRNIFAKSTKNLALFFRKDHGKAELPVIGKGPHVNLLHHLLGQFPIQKSTLNAYPLTKDSSVINQFTPIISELERTDKPRTMDMYIRYRPDQETVERSFVRYFDEQFLSPDMLDSFIKATVRKDVFFAFRIYISKTGRPDMNFIGNEIKYIRHYALHKAKEIEGDLWGVFGIADVVDISDNVLLCHNIDSSTRAQQKTKKHTLLSKW